MTLYNLRQLSSGSSHSKHLIDCSSIGRLKRTIAVVHTPSAMSQFG